MVYIFMLIYLVQITSIDLHNDAARGVAGGGYGGYSPPTISHVYLCLYYNIVLKKWFYKNHILPLLPLPHITTTSYKVPGYATEFSQTDEPPQLIKWLYHRKELCIGTRYLPRNSVDKYRYDVFFIGAMIIFSVVCYLYVVCGLFVNHLHHNS